MPASYLWESADGRTALGAFGTDSPRAIEPWKWGKREEHALPTPNKRVTAWWRASCAELKAYIRDEAKAARTKQPPRRNGRL